MPHSMCHYCYDCSDEGMLVESSFLDEHPGHDVRYKSSRYHTESPTSSRICPACGGGMGRQGYQYVCVNCGATMGVYQPRPSMRRPEDDAAEELRRAEKDAMRSLKDLERALKR